MARIQPGDVQARRSVIPGGVRWWLVLTALLSGCSIGKGESFDASTRMDGGGLSTHDPSLALDASVSPDDGGRIAHDASVTSVALESSETSSSAVQTFPGEATDGDEDGDDCDDGFDCPDPEVDASGLCGNTVVDLVSDEECDDGNTSAEDGCDGCKVEIGWRCEAGESCVALLVDQPCTLGCWAGDTCIEVSSGVTCACPELRPSACADIYLRALPSLGNRASCVASEVSADGAVVVGTCQEDDWTAFPVLWRRGQPPERLAEHGHGLAVSANGFIVALSDPAGPFVLRPPNTAVTDDFATAPYAMNASGSVVVGDSFIWTESAGAFRLASPAGGEWRGVGYDIAESDSPLGGRVVGSAHAENEQVWAAIWSMEGLPSWLARLEGSNASQANGISSDGSTIVGTAFLGGPTTAVSWTSKGIESISPGAAIAVSGDGKLIAGNDVGGWLLDDTLGMRSLKDILTDLGMSLAPWAPLTITDMSSDGHTLTGQAQYLGKDQTNSAPRAIVVYLP